MFRKITSKIITSAIVIGLLMGSVSTASARTPEPKQIKNSGKSPMTLMYHEPIGLTYADWANRALPIGNGEIGAKIFGGVKRDRVQTNEKSLWTGGPSSIDAPNNGGNNPDSYKYVDQARKLLEEGDIDGAKNIAERHLVGPYSREYGNYLPLSDIFLEFDFKDEEVSNYSRSLSLDDAISNITFDLDDTRYTRDFFVSYPDDVLVGKIEAAGKDKLNFTLEVESTEDQSKQPTSDTGETEKLTGENTTKISHYEYDSEDMSVLLYGTVRDNQRKFASYLKITELVGEGASIDVANGKLVINNAERVVFVMNSKTDFEQVFPSYRKVDYEPKVETKRHVDSLNADYEELLANHLEDHRELFSRVELNIGAQPQNYDTQKLLDDYKKGDTSNYLEALLFQYGRYMLIASSRDNDNSLPANLQGVWNAITNPAWNSDYHMNVNLQMNYWPAYVTNLAETAIPLVNYIDDMRESGRIAAEHYGGIKSEDGEENGWLTHTQNTPFGWTTPGWSYYWGWSPSANAWIMENVYEYYEFTKDVSYLENKIYPMLKETAKFWNSFLHYDEASDRYVSSPSYSPEHGPISVGNTFDQSLVAQLFIDFLTAADVVGETDKEFITSIQEKLGKLNPLIVGDSGQIKEWYEEGEYNKYENGQPIPNTDNGHRHVSQLVGLYPGKLFQEEKTLEAARKSLNLRGDGGTGWSKAYKINLWTRVYDGDRAHKLLRELMNNNILDNLWDTHAPFQADGNFGASSGVAEMLLQSHEDYIKPLIALPSVWNSGSYKGLVARGNFDFDVSWDKASATDIVITSNMGEQLKLEYDNLETANIQVNGKDAEVTRIGNNRIVMDTAIGDVVTIHFDNVLKTPKLLDVVRDDNGVNVTFDSVENADSYNILRRDVNTQEVKLFNVQASPFTDKVTNGRYEYSISANSGDDTSNLSEPMELIDTRYAYELDDRDGRVNYYGTWKSGNHDSNFEKTEKITELKEAPGGSVSAQLDFYGTGITVYGVKNSTSSFANIYIDDKLHTSDVSFYGESEIRRAEILNIADLSPGKHTIKIELSDKPIGDNRRISLDSFSVSNIMQVDGSVTTYDNHNIVESNIEEIPLTVKTDSINNYKEYIFEIVDVIKGDADKIQIRNNNILKTNGEKGSVRVRAISVDNRFDVHEGIITFGLTDFTEIEQFDDRDSRIEYGSEWQNWDESGRFMGTEKYIDPSPTIDSSHEARFTFTGDKINIFGLKSAVLGKMTVQVVGDDNIVTVDTKVSGETQLQALLHSIQFDEVKERQIIIKPLINSKISLDYFEVSTNHNYQLSETRDLGSVMPLIAEIESKIEVNTELKPHLDALKALRTDTGQNKFFTTVIDALDALKDKQISVYSITKELPQDVYVEVIAEANAGDEVLLVVDNKSSLDYDFEIVTKDGYIDLSYIGSNTYIFTMPTMDVKIASRLEKVDVDTSELEILIDEYSSLDQGSYTDESWKLFQEEIIKAKAILELPDVSQETVDMSVSNLLKAYSDLEEHSPVDKEGLGLLIKQAAEIDGDAYTQESFNLLTDALLSATTVFNDAEADQNSVDKALAELKLSLESLIPIDIELPVIKDELKTLIDEVESLNHELYTLDSIEILMKVLKEAKEILISNDVDQETVDSIIQKLNSAVDSLVLIDTDPMDPTDPTDPTNPVNPIDPTNPDEDQKLPSTGVSSRGKIYISGIGLILMGGIITRRKRRKEI